MNQGQYLIFVLLVVLVTYDGFILMSVFFLLSARASCTGKYTFATISLVH